MQNSPNETGPPAETSGSGAAAEELFDLSIDVEPYLPDAIVPLWNYLADYPFLLVILMFAIGYGVGKALQWILRSVLNQAAKRTKSTLDDRLIRYLIAPAVSRLIDSWSGLCSHFYCFSGAGPGSRRLQSRSRRCRARSRDSKFSNRVPARSSRWVSSCSCSAYSFGCS